MVLGNRKIFEEQERYKLFSPFHESQVQPASYDLRIGIGQKSLDESAIVIGGGAVNRYTDQSNEDRILIPPKGFVLASTIETVSIPLHLCGSVDGRSSVGRLGLLVHVTAGFIDPGFSGQITLEFANLTDLPIYIVPGTRICQIVLRQVVGCDIGYSGKYNGQKGPTESRIYQDKENV